MGIQLINLESIDPIQALFKTRDWIFLKAHNRLYDRFSPNDRRSVAQMSCVGQNHLLDAIRQLEMRGDIKSGKATATYCPEHDEFKVYMTFDLGLLKPPIDFELRLTIEGIFFVEKTK